MNKDELITKQQLQIEELILDKVEAQKVIQDAIMTMVCIGGPLNDNILKFSHKQRSVFHRINDLLHEVVEYEYAK